MDHYARLVVDQWLIRRMVESGRWPVNDAGTEIQPRFNQDSTEIQPRFNRDSTEIQPRFNQDNVISGSLARMRMKAMQS